jgi:hypothetical protein
MTRMIAVLGKTPWGDRLSAMFLGQGVTSLGGQGNRKGTSEGEGLSKMSMRRE